MTFYPPRKRICTSGLVFLGLFVVALYKYNLSPRLSYVIIAVLTLCIAIYQLVPVIRNQIVEIKGDSIIISSFGNKILLTRQDLDQIEYHHTSIASYQFIKERHYYEITPIAYKNGYDMLQEFIRIFGS